MNSLVAKSAAEGRTDNSSSSRSRTAGKLQQEKQQQLSQELHAKSKMLIEIDLHHDVDLHQLAHC
jgi:hypothetical protein